MIEYFRSSPEATASLLIFALGLLGSTCYLLYTLFANYPVIAQLLTNTSLVSVDSALQDKVKVTFDYLGQTLEIHQLRQIELEIFNTHPRQRIVDKIITIHFKSDKITILGVTAAIIDNQTPELGGRKITTKIEQVPTTPPDLLLGTVAQSFYPTLVIHIPYLDKITENDRVFLRITYNGPFITPQVQGANFTYARTYHASQTVILQAAIFMTAFVGVFFTMLAMRLEGIPIFNLQLYTNPFYLFGMAFTIIFLSIAGILILKEQWFRKWMRTFPNPLIQPPYEPEALRKLYFHDTMS